MVKDGMSKINGSSLVLVWISVWKLSTVETSVMPLKEMPSPASFPARPAEARADRIHHHQIAFIEQRVGIVLHLIWSRREKAVCRERHATRTKRAHVQPYRRRAWPPIERKSQRPFGSVLPVK